MPTLGRTLRQGVVRPPGVCGPGKLAGGAKGWKPTGLRPTGLTESGENSKGVSEKDAEPGCWRSGGVTNGGHLPVTPMG